MWLRLLSSLLVLGLFTSGGVGVAQQPPPADEGCMLRVEGTPPRSSSGSPKVLEVWLPHQSARQQTPAFFEVPCGQVQVRYAYRACAGTAQFEVQPGVIGQFQIDGDFGEPARIELVTRRTGLARIDEWRRRGQRRVGPWEELPGLERSMDGEGLQDPEQTTGTLMLTPQAQTETMGVSGTERVPGKAFSAEEVEAARRSGQPLVVEASCGTRFLRTTWAMPEPPAGARVIKDQLALEVRTGETLQAEVRGYARLHLLPPRGRMDAEIAFDDAREVIGRHIVEPGTTLVLPAGTWEITASHEDWAQDCVETVDLVAGSTTRHTPCAE